MSDVDRFATLSAVGRIWAIGSIHGEADRLAALHDALWPRLQWDDRIVYLGNYLGYGAAIRETMTELVRFRRFFLARPPYTDPTDIVFLRGGQEEMWHKMMQLQFAIDPGEVLRWMLRHGAEATLRAYDGNPADGSASAREGALALTRWCGTLRNAMRAAPGHYTLMSALKRAAQTVGVGQSTGGLLFVNAGIDTTRPLSAQADSFWWAGRSFPAIDRPFGSYRRIIRGYDPDHGGFAETPLTVTVDGGCGFGGMLLAACFAADGTILDLIEA